MKELTAKALSLAYIGRMPITVAATSMSRIAIHCRPMLPRTRFFAIRLKTTRMPRQKRYLSVGVLMVQPIRLISATETEPDDEALETHLRRRKAQSQKNCAASVATAR